MKNILIIILMLITNFIFSQEIVTAVSYFGEVSKRYSNMRDYSANINITISNANNEQNKMSGRLSYLKPNKILIKFSNPRDQILVSNGSYLKIYIPRLSTVLTQNIEGKTDANGIATEEGLSLLKSKYSIAYTSSGPNFVNLENGIKVKKILLSWRNSQEGFRQIIISIDEDKIIRRIEGTTANYKKVVFDFTNIRLNQNISVNEFENEINAFPPNANEFLNFLY